MTLSRVHRVILALTPNPLYTGYWDFVSRVWAEKFDVKPTLVFNGSEAELSECGLSSDYGDIIRVDRIDDVVLNRQRDWSCTWSLFYAAARFSDEVCMTCGIDQVPLSGRFFDAFAAAEVNEAEYAVCLSDAYGVADRFPSSHHIALGRTFQAAYTVNQSWSDEVRKVFDQRGRFTQASDSWGLDESYSSNALTRSPTVPVRLLRLFRDVVQPGRLDRSAHRIDTFDLAAVATGRFTEWHGDRPFSATADQSRALFESIPAHRW